MPKEIKPKSIIKSGGYLSIFKESKAIGFLIAQGFTFSILMTFLTNAPFAYIEYFKVSETNFSLLLILNVVGVTIANRVNNFLLHKNEPANLLNTFLKVQLFGVLILFVSIILFPTSLWLTVLGFVITTSSLGGVIPNASACFMNYFGNNAGIAAATLGATQYILGAIVSAIAALLSQDTLWPIIVVILCSTLIAISGAIYSSKKCKFDCNKA